MSQASTARNNQNHGQSDRRAFCLALAGGLAGIAFGKEAANAARPEKQLNPLSLVRAASSLSSDELAEGKELVLGRSLLLHVDPDGSLEQDAMPLLANLRFLEERCPQLFDELNTNSEAGMFFCRELLSEVRAERQRERGGYQKLFKKELNILVGLHDDLSSWPDRARKRVEELVAPSRIHRSEVIYTPLVNGRICSPKNIYRKQLEEFVGDVSRPLVLWNTGHGGPNHFWFMGGVIGAHHSENLSEPKAFSYQEFSRLLVEEGSKDGEVDLSRVVMIQDACFQFNLTCNLFTDIIQQCASRDLALKRFPRVITSSQRGMPDWITLSHARQSGGGQQEIHAVGKEPGSYLQNTFRAVTREKPKPVFDRLLSCDILLNAKISDSLGSAESTRLDGQDLAIFSSTPVDAGKLAGRIAETLRKKGHRLTSELPVEKVMPFVIA